MENVITTANETPETLFQTLNRVEQEQFERKEKYRLLFEAKPDGTVIKGWTKITVPCDTVNYVFWQKKNRTVVYLLEEIGTEAAHKALGI